MLTLSLRASARAHERRPQHDPDSLISFVRALVAPAPRPALTFSDLTVATRGTHALFELRRNVRLLVLTALLVVLSVFYQSHHSLNAMTLGRLNAARAHAGLPTLSVPANFVNDTPAQQLAYLIDNERRVHHLGIGEMSSVGHAFVDTSLATGQDPVPFTSLPGVVMVNTIWGWSSIDGLGLPATTVAALEYIDYSWIYDDGWNGSRAATSNIDCTSPHAPACNGHREAILSPDIPGATLIIVPGVAYTTAAGQMGTAAAAELIWTTQPQLFSPTPVPGVATP